MTKPRYLKEPMDTILSIPEKLPSNAVKTDFYSVPVWEFKNVLNSMECQQVIHHFSKNPSYGVGVQGLSTDHGIGSQRVSAFDINFAKFLDKKLSKFICIMFNPLNRMDINAYSKVDAPLGSWDYMHISPFFRYMKYNKDGNHFTHYDAPHVYNENYRTLLSGVLYLTTNDSCPTVFIDDNQDHLPFNRRNTEDWTRPHHQDEVLCKSYPEAGKIILFQHQQAHAVEALLKDEDRIIVRFDVYYSKD